MTAGARLDGFRLGILTKSLPPSPNSRPGNRHEEARLFREWRDAAQTLAADELRKAPKVAPMALCDVSVLVIVKDRRRRDHDNIAASLKPITDGLVLAGVMADDSIDVIRSFRVLIEREPGRKDFEIVYHVVDAIRRAEIGVLDPTMAAVDIVRELRP